MELTRADLSQHISSQFNDELERLRTLVLKMAGLVERNLRDALTSLNELDSSAVDGIRSVEKQINTYELAIDREVVSLIALRQPAAADLRVIMSISKIVRDLERMGDEAFKVGVLASQLASDPPPAAALNLASSLGRQVAELVTHSVDAFVRLDADLASQVRRDDRAVDAEYEAAIRALVTYMIEDPRSIGRIVKLQWLFRSLERIGDHATNVSEQLIYAVRGQDLRHNEVTGDDIEALLK